MSAASLRARYLGDAVATSSPQQVLVMLYDRLALDLERAQKAVAAGERGAASEQLQHAQAIVLELLSSLQVDAWDLRLVKRKETLTRQFTAMETALSSLRNQSTWLAGQINGLPSGG